VECQASPRALTIVERRPLWRADPGSEWTSSPVARLRYSQADRTWTLHWCDQHSRFHRYQEHPPTSQVTELLREIGDDPAALFWG
jgi:hypothetical protein